MRILIIAALVFVAGCSDPVPTEGRLFSVCDTPIIFWWAESDGSLNSTQDIGTMRGVLEQMDEGDVGRINWCPKPRDETSEI